MRLIDLGVEYRLELGNDGPKGSPFLYLRKGSYSVSTIYWEGTVEMIITWMKKNNLL